MTRILAFDVFPHRIHTTWGGGPSRLTRSTSRYLCSSQPRLPGSCVENFGILRITQAEFAHRHRFNILEMRSDPPS
jgi:hypothetical protein